MTAVALQTEYLTDPIGLDAPAPLFTWKFPAGTKEAPTGCRVRVCLEHELIWDSGRVDTRRPQLTYGGPRLQSMQMYRWSVCLYWGDDQGAWSEEATFEMGLLTPEDWQARWIGITTCENYVVHCRHVRDLPKKVIWARAYLAAVGYAQLWINGKRVCDDVLDPANTDYDKRVLYRTFDIKDMLVCGTNAFGVRLNRGWALRGKCLLQIHVMFEDGTTDVIATQPGSWKIALSPIYYATIYGGEFYDARLEDSSWCDPSDTFEKTHTPRPWGFYEYIQDPEDPMQRWWYPAIEMPAPAGVLQMQNVEPVRNLGEVAAVKVTAAPDGSQVVDFGENLAGWVRIRMHGQRGDKVTMEHSELLKPDGSLNMDYLTSAAPFYPLPMQRDTYVFADDKQATYEPEFTYHGFRYVAVKGLKYPLKPEDVTAVIGCSDVSKRSCFGCGNELVEKIYRAAVRSEQTNMFSIPTDCPQRAERHGWLNDMTARTEAAVYQFDLRRFYRKFVEDIRTAQDPVSGAIPDVVPYRHGNFPGDPVDCYQQLPYMLYWHYGDRVTLEHNYDAMKKLTLFWDRNITDGVLPFSLYGDWASPEGSCVQFQGKPTPVSRVTPGAFVSTCHHYYNLTLMADCAVYTGHQQDEAFFRDRMQQRKQEILDRFYDPATGNFATGSQGANAMALQFGLAPEGAEHLTVQRILEDIASRDGALTTGNLGTKYLLETLSKYGHVDTAYALITRTQYPSWGYMMEHGATTIWERWEYKTGVDMNSHNHAMYGSFVAWMYKYLAGITPLEPGFRRTSICPYIPKDLPAASATVDTAYGPVKCAWKQTGEEVVVDVTIPLGVEAVVCLPGKMAEDARYHDGRWELLCSQGDHRFVCKK